MTNTLKGMDAQTKDPAAAGKNMDEAAAAARDLSQAERVLVGDLVRQARAEGVALTGPDGLLKALTKTMTGSCSGNRYARRPPALG